MNDYVLYHSGYSVTHLKLNIPQHAYMYKMRTLCCAYNYNYKRIVHLIFTKPNKCDEGIMIVLWQSSMI